jgi:hypothetical protein
MQKLFTSIILISSILLSPTLFAKAEIVFDGYYKILSGKVHIGYVVQSFKYHPTKKQFSSTYYIETNALGGSMKESLHAIADDQFRPVSYAYTAQAGKVSQIIDASFKQVKGISVMTAVIKKGKTVEKIQDKKLPKNTFLSTFLGFKLLQKKFKLNSKFKYSAIAEEDGHAYTGNAWVKKEDTHLGKPVLRVLNVFKNTKFISYVTKDAEVLGTKSPLQQLETQLVSSPHFATKGFQINTKALNQLFGKIPGGSKNILAKTTEKK